MALTDGIIGCWSPSLGVTGNVLRDVSGKNNHGTLQNMDPTTDWVSTSVRGVSGRVLDFDGVNDHLNCGQSGGNLTETLPFSVTAWAMARTVGANRGLISRDQSTPYSFSIRFNGDTGLGILSDGGLLFGPTITTNQWFFYCATFATNRRIIYLNGTSRVDNSTPYAISANNDPLLIGSDYIPASDRCWDGQIGEIAIFRRALTAAEVMELYRQGNGAIGRQLTDYNRRKYFPLYPSKPSKASLINVKPSTPSFENGFAPRDGEADNPNLLKGLVGAWCPSLGVTGNTLRDISGRNNHGTLTNMDPATDWVVDGGQYALTLDGVNDVIDCGDVLNNVFVGTAARFSIFAWINVTTSQNQFVASKIESSPTANRQWFLRANDNGLDFAWYGDVNAGTYRVARHARTFTTSGWVHVGVDFDATVASADAKARLYIDGVQVATTIPFTQGSPVSIQTGTARLAIGGAVTSGGTAGSAFAGSVDDVVIYNRLLTPNEMRQLYLLGRGAIYTLKSQKKIVTSPSRSTPKSRASIIVRPPKPNTDNLLKGIVGCWSPSLGVTGNTLRDVSGRNNHGVLTDMDPATDWVTTSVRGVSGRVLDFDGVNDRVAIGAAPVIRAPLTISAWVNVADLSTNRTVVSIHSGGVSRFLLYITSSAGAAFFVTDGTFVQANIASIVTTNTWFHLVGIESSTSRRVIYNAATEATATGTIVPSGINAMQIGADSTSGAAQFFQNGRIGEVAIYNRALSSAEVLELYRQGNGAIGRALTQQATRSNFSSKTFPSTWLKVGDEWTEVQPKVATGSQTSIITRPPIEPSYESGYAPRDGEPLYPNLHKGLVGAWCPSLGVTGRVLRDVSGRNNHGTLTNMDPATDWQVQNGQYSLAFVSPKRVVMSATALQPLSYSVSVWAKRNTIASFYRVVWGLGVGLSISMWVYGNGDIAFGKPSGTWSTVSAIWTDTADWHHIVINVRNSAVLTGHELFFDGKLVGQFSGSEASGAWSDPVLGFWSLTYAGIGFDGWLDDWQWRGRATTPQEVAQWYRLGRGGILTLKQPSLKNTSTIWQPSQPRLYTGDWT